jgi:sulfonate transport system substrate-binding protein
MRLLKVLLGAALALPLTVAAAFAQQPLKIRIAWTVPVANSPTILYQKPDILKFKGKSYDIELIYFQGTPLMITALQANEVDIALLAYSSLALAIQNAGMEDLRVIADEAQEGVDGYYTSPFMVRKDSGIDKVEDVKGKVIANVGAGSAVDIAMRAMLKKHGLEDKRDYTMVEAAFPNMRALLGEKKADLVSVVLPFSIDPQLLEIAKPLYTVKEAIGRSQFIVWVARQGFLSKNKAAMTDFMDDSAKSLHYLMDPKNRNELMEIAARVGKRPAAAYSSWMYTKNDLYRDPDLVPDLDALQRSVDVQQSMGFLKNKIDIKKYADLSFVQEAKKRAK